MSLPNPATFPSLAPSTLTQTLDTLLEPTPSLHPLLLHIICQSKPASYTAFITILENELLHLCSILEDLERDPSTATQPLTSTDGTFSYDAAAVRTIIGEVMNSHPRLGAPNPAPTTDAPHNPSLSTLSAAEQRAMNVASTAKSTVAAAPDPDSETAQLAQLNGAYEAAYPGLRFVTFVAGRPRSAIMEEMRAAIARKGAPGALAEERRKAAVAVCRIAEARVEAVGVDGKAAGA